MAAFTAIVYLPAIRLVQKETPRTLTHDPFATRSVTGPIGTRSGEPERVQLFVMVTLAGAPMTVDMKFKPRTIPHSFRGIVGKVTHLE